MNQLPARRTGLNEQRIGDEVYIFAAGGERLAVLNAVAMLVWSLCDGMHDRADMVSVLRDIFPETPVPVLETDLHACLDTFQQEGLLQPPS